MVRALQSGNASAELAAWDADGIALQSDAQAATANPPPACADAADYAIAMQSLSTAGGDAQRAVSDVNNGDVAGAVAVINALNRELRTGNAAIARQTSKLPMNGGLAAREPPRGRAPAWWVPGLSAGA